ncbi:dipeptide ABC transporter ATP-binding protein DppD, partial [Rhizobium ruizarguesonis]
CLFAPRCGCATVECYRGVVRQGPELGLALCNYPLKDGKPLGHPGIMAV